MPRWLSVWLPTVEIVRNQWGNSVTDVSKKLANISKIMIKSLNDLMKINPYTFQLILFSRTKNSGLICVNVNGTNIEFKIM
jgi:hypothetical protein